MKGIPTGSNREGNQGLEKPRLRRPPRRKELRSNRSGRRSAGPGRKARPEGRRSGPPMLRQRRGREGLRGAPAPDGTLERRTGRKLRLSKGAADRDRRCFGRGGVERDREELRLRTRPSKGEPDGGFGFRKGQPIGTAEASAEAGSRGNARSSGSGRDLERQTGRKLRLSEGQPSRIGRVRPSREGGRERSLLRTRTDPEREGAQLLIEPGPARGRELRLRSKGRTFGRGRRAVRLWRREKVRAAFGPTPLTQGSPPF
jgi:hypothetical protein